MSDPTTAETPTMRERLAERAYMEAYPSGHWPPNSSFEEYWYTVVDAILREMHDPGDAFFDRLERAYLSRAERPEWEAVAAAWQEGIQSILNETQD